MKMNIKDSTKQVFKNSTLVVLAAAMSLSSCKDKEVAPKTEPGTEVSFEKSFENGFIKGTIKGKRQDGTAFEEPFEYKIASDQAYFEKVSPTDHVISLWRSMGIARYDNYINLDVVVTNKDQAGTTAKIRNAELEFTKALSDKNLFYINAGPNFLPTNVTFPISRANNATYKLVNHGIGVDYTEDSSTGESYYFVKDTDGNTIYFNGSQTYDPVAGDYYYAFRHIISSTGVKSTTSPVWSNVRMIRGEGNNMAFVTKAGADLFEIVEVPADTQEITNYAYNAATGVVTFNYKLSINALRGYDSYYYSNMEPANTTMNALEITGSVSATVHNGVVMRRSAQ